MKREILFRGKKKGTSEWVCGSLVLNGSESVVIIENRGTVITKQSNTFWSIETPAFEVIPETVGQFTGTTDKNETKIFEGDIVRFERQMPIENMFTDYETGGEIVQVDHTVDFIKHTAEFSLFPIKCHDLMNQSLTCSQFMEVVGNIYDNPELLK